MAGSRETHNSDMMARLDFGVGMWCVVDRENGFDEICEMFFWSFDDLI